MGQQATSPPESSGGVIRSSVREVMLDVVVRRKNQQLARKLKASDFTVTEDGVPQKIKAFRLVSGKDSEPPAAPEESSAPRDKTAAPVRRVAEPAYVSIVFEELSPQSRKYARDAALEFLSHELRAGTYVAIFSLYNQLVRLQSFSNDRDLLAQAVARAALSNYSSLTSANSKTLNQFDYAISTSQAGVSISPTTDPFTTPEMATAGADANLGDQSAVIQSQQREIAMYMNGMRTVDALLNLVQYESRLPGRKTVLYVCEGMNLPPGQRERIDHVISAANRANVSFYGIDARGLLPGNPNALAKNLNRSVAATSVRQSRWNNTGADESMAKQDDAIFEMGAANTQQNMQELSERTGGFAVMNTNEIGKNMIRVMEDVRTHYEITYTPASTIYDGGFRKVRVSVNNARLEVQSRDGYYALPELNGHPLEPFEIPGLDALTAKTPSTFPFRVAALRFGPESGGARYEIAFDLPIGSVSENFDPLQDASRIHATFLALVKNANGDVIAKVSRDIDRIVPGRNIEAFRRGEIIFTSPVVLPAGRYTIESVALDPQGKRSSTRRFAITAGPPAPLALSDVVLVHDFQPLASPRDPDDPLQFAGGRVTPELDSKAPAAANASLYFVLYPGKADGTPRATVQFYKDGSEVAEVEPKLSALDEIGSIPVVASAKLPPGDYVARVTVHQDRQTAQQSLPFTVTP